MKKISTVCRLSNDHENFLEIFRDGTDVISFAMVLAGVKLVNKHKLTQRSFCEQHLTHQVSMEECD
jgi:hypothetical protein